jgi:hypothetical protein
MILPFIQSIDGHSSPNPPYAKPSWINTDQIEAASLPYCDSEPDGERYIEIRLKSGVEIGGYQQHNKRFWNFLKRRK